MVDRKRKNEYLDLQDWTQKWVDHELHHQDMIFKTFYEEKIIDKIFGDE